MIDRKLPESADAVGAMGLNTPNTCVSRCFRAYSHAIARLQTVHKVVTQRYVDRARQLAVRPWKRGNLSEGSALGHFLDGDGLEVDVFGVAEFELERLFCESERRERGEIRSLLVRGITLLVGAMLSVAESIST